MKRKAILLAIAIPLGAALLAAQDDPQLAPRATAATADKSNAGPTAVGPDSTPQQDVPESFTRSRRYENPPHLEAGHYHQERARGRSRLCTNLVSHHPE